LAYSLPKFTVLFFLNIYNRQNHCGDKANGQEKKPKKSLLGIKCPPTGGGNYRHNRHARQRKYNYVPAGIPENTMDKKAHAYTLRRPQQGNKDQHVKKSRGNPGNGTISRDRYKPNQYKPGKVRLFGKDSSQDKQQVRSQGNNDRKADNVNKTVHPARKAESTGRYQRTHEKPDNYRSAAKQKSQNSLAAGICGNRSPEKIKQGYPQQTKKTHATLYTLPVENSKRIVYTMGTWIYRAN
jgi:hypothetical protein